MSPETKQRAWVLGDPISSVSSALVSTLKRLRSRGGFGLTFLVPSDNLEFLGAEGGDDAFGEDAMLPGTGSGEAALNLRPPSDSPPAQIKPEQLLDLMQQPPEIDLRDAFDPGTSTMAELDEKHRELQYRKDWLEALLAVTRDELAAFDEARKQRLLKDENAK